MASLRRTLSRIMLIKHGLLYHHGTRYAPQKGIPFSNFTPRGAPADWQTEWRPLSLLADKIWQIKTRGTLKRRIFPVLVPNSERYPRSIGHRITWEWKHLSTFCYVRIVFFTCARALYEAVETLFCYHCVMVRSAGRVKICYGFKSFGHYLVLVLKSRRPTRWLIVADLGLLKNLPTDIWIRQ